MAQLLETKTAVVYGAAGAIGSAVARAFAHEGAHVHLTSHRFSFRKYASDLGIKAENTLVGWRTPPC
jgi:NAD(P)-dependent dehydrogenase (short-subunit alcohol dehydrogenase family)